VFVRECISESRQWQALNAIVVFALVALTSISMGLRGDRLDSPAVAGGLFWTVQFFTAMSALPRCFVREEDAGTATALRLAAPPAAVYLGKLAFNAMLAIGLDVLLIPGFMLFINRPVASVGLLIGSAATGSMALVAASTILSAIASRAGSRTTLFAVMAFPLLLPVLIPAIHATAIAYGLHGDPAGDLRFMASYGMMSLVAAVMLFPLVWWA
jgi:heme exporter protein B